MSSRFCRTATAPAPGAHTEEAGCNPDLPPDRVSAFLVRLAPGARMDEVRFALARMRDVRIVEGNPVQTASRQALSTLLIGGVVFAAFQFVALLILVSLLFSAIVRERYREVGLLRAMGARPAQVIIMILAEAALITGLGGLAGLVLGVAAAADLRPLAWLLFRSARRRLFLAAFADPGVERALRRRCCRRRSDLPEPFCRHGGPAGPRRSA